MSASARSKRRPSMKLTRSAPAGAARAVLLVVCSVIDVNASPVTSAAKGAKKYLVLPFGSSLPVIVEERYIKKYKKKMEFA